MVEDHDGETSSLLPNGHEEERVKVEEPSSSNAKAHTNGHAHHLERQNEVHTNGYAHPLERLDEVNDKEDDAHIEDNLPSTSSATVPLVVNCSKHTRFDELQKNLEAPTPCRLDKDAEDAERDDQHKKNSWKVSVMITITFLFFFVELFVGILNKSIALLADSYHMLSDVMALVIALVCLRISRRRSKKNGFGWVRAEVMGALANGVFLLAMCFMIAIEALGRIVHPRPMTHPIQVLIVGVIGLLINVIGIGMFHGAHGHTHGGGGGHGHSHGGGHGHSHGGGKNHSEHSAEEGSDTSSHSGSDDPPKRMKMDRSMSQLSTDVSHNHLALRLLGVDDAEVDEDLVSGIPTKKKPQQHVEAENLNMRGVLLHIMADAIGSIFVIVTAAASYWFADRMGAANNYLDPVLSLSLVALISYSAYNLVAQTADIIMRRTPTFLDLEGLKGDVSKISGVSAVYETNVWTLVGNRHIGTLDVEFCSVAAFDQASPKIRRLFHRNNIHSLTIQPSFSTTCILEETVTNGVLEEIPE